MSAIRKTAGVTLIRFNLSSTIQLPRPIETPIDKPIIEIVNKPYILAVVQIPPPYCPICNSFLTQPFCNKMIKPILCPMNGD